MARSYEYNGGLTAEKFLFHEIRIVAQMYLDNKSGEEIIQLVSQDNLFQYPTEREIKRLTKACYRRIIALEDLELIRELTSPSLTLARQINLYAMMRDNLLVWEFMVGLIGEKYRSLDFSFTPGDLNLFFTRLQQQQDKIAGWSDGTINRIKSLFRQIMIETDYLDSKQDTQLNHIMISEELKQGIIRNGDAEALAAFNCFQ